MYMTQALHRFRRENPNGCAAIDEGASLTWAELNQRVARFAGALLRSGAEPGDRVALLARNSVEYLIYVLGTFWAGAVINPVNWRLAPPEIAYSLMDCQTRFLIVSEEFTPIVDAIRRDAPCLTQVVFIGGDAPEGTVAYSSWLAGAQPVADMLRKGDNLAGILYTGGTTGRARGVMLSHDNLATSTFGILVATNDRSTQRHLHVPPLFHIGALSNVFMALTVGATSAFLPVFEPSKVLKAVQEWQITEFFLVPTMFRMLIDHPDFKTYDLSSVRLLRYGAAPLDEALLNQMMRAFPDAGFVQAYGMTELGPVATVLSPADHLPDRRVPARLRSAGRATPTCEVRVVDADGCEVPPGQVGEITARGSNVMLGYWGLPEATSQALRGGWMHTGDLGTMDPDGYLTIVDRLKDMIVTGGENVYSVEVENAIATHPDVAQVAVVGVPDPVWGERVHAMIVPRPGTMPCPDEIQAHCRAAIGGYKMPRSFAFVESLPLSPAGKVLKNVLREQALALSA